MIKYVAFLRGINVGGRNKINMAELKQLFTDSGLTDPVTYLNSGNVVFNSMLLDPAELELKLKKLILDKFGLEIEVILRTGTELEAIITADPFSSIDNNYVVLLRESSSIDISSEVERVKSAMDKCFINKKEVHLLLPGGFGKTKLTNGFFEKKLKVAGTTRNIKTMKKLLSLMVKI